jgi:hypothetical protein
LPAHAVAVEGVTLTLGAGFGITDDFEVGALVIPLLLSPEVDFGNPQIYAMYRFVPGEVEVGARVDFSIPVQDGSDATLRVGVPVRFHLAPATAVLDTGGFLVIQFADPDAVLGLSIPANFTFNITPNIFAQLNTGFTIGTFDAAGDSIIIPLGFGGMTSSGGPAGVLASTGSSTGVMAMTPRAVWRIACAAGSSGSV